MSGQAVHVLYLVQVQKSQSGHSNLVKTEADIHMDNAFVLNNGDETADYVLVFFLLVFCLGHIELPDPILVCVPVLFRLV